MKKTINYLLIPILTIILFGISSCKKYEHGGNNFRIEKKLINRNWELSYVDISSEEIYNKDIALTLKKIYFNDDGKFYVNNDNWGDYNFNKKSSNIMINITNQDYFHLAALLFNQDTSHINYSLPYSFPINIKELRKDKLRLSLFNVKNSKIHLCYE